MGNLEQAMKDNTKGNSFLTYDITNMDIFKDTIMLIIEVCKDKRIEKELREEYKLKLFNVINEDEYYTDDIGL